jgi:uncharacterized protein (DUF488 family)
MTGTLFTIGHSSHTIEVFLGLLARHGIEAVADVRSHPHSGRFPQFSKQPLVARLGQQGIRHVFLGQELGARREEAECYVDGAARYDLIAGLPAFRAGLERLIEGAARMRIALLCAEKDPLTCHRAILVSRHLKNMGLDVAHILDDGSLESHTDAEQRLMLEERFVPGQADIFGGTDDTQALTAAYGKRGKKLCYKKSDDDDENSDDRLYAQER